MTDLDILQDPVAFEPTAGGPAGVNIQEEALADLDGLAALTKVSAPMGVSITLSKMPALVDAAGLDAFAGVEGPVRLVLREMPVLTALQWSGPLDELAIDDAPVLQQLALPAVTTARRVSLEKMPALTSLAGLSALTSVSEELLLGPCNGDGLAAIVDLQGLEALAQVGLLVIDGNGSLTALTGLSTALAADDVLIRSNPNLPQSEAQAWLDAADLMNTDSLACGNLGGAKCPGCPVQ